jgi:hypothetical protein
MIGAPVKDEMAALDYCYFNASARAATDGSSGHNGKS